MLDENIRWTNRRSGSVVDLDVLKRKSWPGTTVHYVRIPAPLIYDVKLSKSQHHIIHYDVYRTDGETIVPGASPSFIKDLRGKLAFVPDGYELNGWSKIEKNASLVVIALDALATTRHAFNFDGAEPRIHFSDPMLRSLVLRFQAILDDPSLDVPGYAETLSELLVYELARITSPDHASEYAPRGLSLSQMRQIIDYMDAHLSEKVTIADLSAVIDLTRFHFIRAFRQTANVPPHQFMIRRRVERAKDLLLTQPRYSIAEVAGLTGFTAVQMTRAFRKFVGTTPSEVRRSQA